MKLNHQLHDCMGIGTLTSCHKYLSLIVFFKSLLILWIS